MNNNLVENLLSDVKKYAQKGNLTSKNISWRCNDIFIKIKFERVGKTPQVGIFIYAENQHISSIARQLLKTRSDYAIVMRSPLRPSGRYPFSLNQFSSEEKEYLITAMSTLIPEFVARYHSLTSIEKSLREDMVSGAFKKFELPEIYMKLSMIKFALGEDWREYLSQAKILGSDVFKKTLERLEKVFTTMPSFDLPEPPAPAK